MLTAGIDNLELAESTAIGDALSVGTRLLVNSADPRRRRRTMPPGVMVLLSDGETTVGRLTSDGARRRPTPASRCSRLRSAPSAGVIPDPETGDVVPVPVRPADLELVAETTGGEAFEARTGDELASAYDQIAESLGENDRRPDRD